MQTEKDYCDYDTCVALWEMGLIPHPYDNTDMDKVMAIISLYEAQKWLREVKKIDISVTISPFEYFATIREFVFWQGEYSWEKTIHPNGGKTYEEALFEGIKEAVKLLKKK